MPGARPTTCSSICAMNSCSGIDISCSLCRTSDVPLRHVIIRVAIAAPTTSGNQPPSWIFSEFDARKMRSIVPNSAMMGIATARGHCQRVIATR